MPLKPLFEPLFTTAEMGAADKAAPGAGMPSMTLMENAGCAVADAIGRRFTAQPVIVLCGPGNNGGDGFVAARLLQHRGWPVRCEALGDPAKLKGDAAEAFQRWKGETIALAGATERPGSPLLIDALFGAGLSRPLEGAAADLAKASADWAQRVIAIDAPSGLHGDTGLPLGGIAFKAGLTVTFVRRKPGHLLMPGRTQCGEIVLADIGMPPAALEPAAGDAPTWSLAGATMEEGNPSAHKYDRGHCLVFSGPPLATGATRLAAMAAARSGAGLTTIAGTPEAAAVHANHLTAIMVRGVSGPAGLTHLLDDKRKNAIVIGPGLGSDDDARHTLDAVLATQRAAVVDADALTLIGKDGASGLARLHDRCVLTPHAGEFARVFPDIAHAMKTTGKLAAARAAAKRAGCVVLLKGADTVIAAPDGRAAIDALSPPTLATAGSGDVLAGMIGGLLAQHLEPFEAACAATWLHGAAARQLGPGLTADDLPSTVPAALAVLTEASSGPT